MPNMTGRFTGKYTVQSVITLHDAPDHQLMLSEMGAIQSASDENFNNTRQTGWSTADVTQGAGQQRGYFVNEHPNGDRDCGTYEGTLSISNGQSTIEGTWKFTHGTGKFAGITGNGKFKGRQTSLTEVEMNWEGSYQLAAGTRAA